MSLLEIKHVNKIYKSEDGGEKYALKDVTIIFPSSGLIAICGKSGSGKSTLINMIALLDKPDSGNILFNNKELTSYKDKEILNYRNKEIGIIFQHYQLLLDEDVLFNVSLPMMIAGYSKKEGQKDASMMLEGINFNQELYKQRTYDLSGGEQQRVAILRSLINSPKIILADEPTGAIDSTNSRLIMQMLKKASRKKLVILVSHNEELVEEFADRIINLQDGEIVKNIIRVEENNGRPVSKPPIIKRHYHWISHLAISNFIKRIKRNIISMVSLTLCLVSSLLIIGFSYGSETSIINESYKQVDYGVASISKETSTRISDSGMTLKHLFKPNQEEKKQIIDDLPYFHIMENYDALVPMALTIKSEGKTIDNIYYQPVYSFSEKTLNYGLLKDGFIPSKDCLQEILINQKAYEVIKKTGIDPFKAILTITSSYTYNYYPEDDYLHPVITDYFIYEKNAKITGVFQEFDFLNTPKVYYSYVALDNYLNNSLLNNLSSYLEEDYSWGDIVSSSEVNDPISSYSLKLFLKDDKDKTNLRSYVEALKEPFAITSNSLMIDEALTSLVSAANYGLGFFLAIAFIGTALILGIVSFSSFVEDRKKIAILKCLGAKRSDIVSIYMMENIFISLISVTLSLILSYPLSLFINFIVKKTLGFTNLISIPFSSFLNVPFLLPFILVVASLLLSIISTGLPIIFSKKISLKEELKDE